MKFIKIESGSLIYAVMESVGLGYFLISLHGCESSAQKQIKRLLGEDIKKYGRSSKDYFIEELTFEKLFSNY